MPKKDDSLPPKQVKAAAEAILRKMLSTPPKKKSKPQKNKPA